MANNMTTYLRNKLADHVVGNTAYTMPTTLYAALYTTATTDAGGGTEVTGGGYARKAVDFGAAAAGATENVTETSFGTATANWGTITNIAFFDAETAGNMLFHGPLTASKTINNTDEFTFPAGSLDIDFNQA